MVLRLKSGPFCALGGTAARRSGCSPAGELLTAPSGRHELAPQQRPDSVNLSVRCCCSVRSGAAAEASSFDCKLTSRSTPAQREAARRATSVRVRRHDRLASRAATSVIPSTNTRWAAAHLDTFCATARAVIRSAIARTSTRAAAATAGGPPGRVRSALTSQPISAPIY